MTAVERVIRGFRPDRPATRVAHPMGCVRQLRRSHRGVPRVRPLPWGDAAGDSAAGLSRGSCEVQGTVRLALAPAPTTGVAAPRRTDRPTVHRLDGAAIRSPCPIPGEHFARGVGYCVDPRSGYAGRPPDSVRAMSRTRRVRCAARLTLAEGVTFRCERTAGHHGPHEHRGLAGFLNAFEIHWADLLESRRMSRSTRRHLSDKRRHGGGYGEQR